MVFALASQGVPALLGLGGVKPYLRPQQFDAREAVLGQSGTSITRALWTCAVHALVPLLSGWAIFARRDVARA